MATNATTFTITSIATSKTKTAAAPCYSGRFCVIMIGVTIIVTGSGYCANRILQAVAALPTPLRPSSFISFLLSVAPTLFPGRDDDIAGYLILAFALRCCE